MDEDVLVQLEKDLSERGWRGIKDVFQGESGGGEGVGESIN